MLSLNEVVQLNMQYQILDQLLFFYVKGMLIAESTELKILIEDRIPR